MSNASKYERINVSGSFAFAKHIFRTRVRECRHLKTCTYNTCHYHVPCVSWFSLRFEELQTAFWLGIEEHHWISAWFLFACMLITFACTSSSKFRSKMTDLHREQFALFRQIHMYGVCCTRQSDVYISTSTTLINSRILIAKYLWSKSAAFTRHTKVFNKAPFMNILIDREIHVLVNTLWIDGRIAMKYAIRWMRCQHY